MVNTMKRDVHYLHGNMHHPAGWYYRIPGEKRKGPFATEEEALQARTSCGRTRHIGDPCEECGYDHDIEPARADLWHAAAEDSRLRACREDA